MGRPPSPYRDKFIIRLPDGMRDQLKEISEANGRSMTAEIVDRLQRTFEEDAERTSGKTSWIKTAMKRASVAETSILTKPSTDERLNNLENEMAMVKEKLGLDTEPER